MRLRCYSSSALALALVASVAQAQVPGPASPGRLDDRFKTPVAPQSVPEITILATGQAAPPEQAAQSKFILTGVIIDGNTVYKPASLEPLYRALIGKEVSLLDIYKLRDALTAKYRADGYVLSQAIIPPQTIQGGVVHLQVVEGYISGVSLEGDTADRRGLIRRMAEKITRSRPLRAGDLERYVLLIGDLPGLTVNTVIKPGTAPGAANLVVVLHRAPVSGSASADNRGSIAIGPEEFSGGIDANSLLGLNEQTGLQLATVARSRELFYWAFHHEETLTSEGLKLSLSASSSRSHPGGALAVLDPLGLSQSYRVRLSESVIRSRSHTLTISGGLSALNSTTDLLSTRFSTDRVRSLFLDGAYDFADTALGDSHPATNIFSIELDRGLDGLGATKSGSAGLSRANGRSDFTKLSGEATRIQSLTPALSLSLDVSGQWSADPLLSSQQFGLGGARFGRGYEPSELTGDNGAALSVEGRYVLPPGLPLIKASQLYAFYEAGEVWQKSPLAGQVASASLASTGIGLRLSFGPHFNADFELAKPLTRDIASRGNRDVRPMFALSTQF